MSDVADSRSADRYRHQSGVDYHESRHDASESVRARVTAERARKFQAYISPSSQVVELGVGPGWNLAGLVCSSKTGVDVATAYEADMAALGIEFSSRSSALPDRSADVVISHHMLEHVTSPADVILEAHRILRDRGVFLLFVPYETQRRYRRFDPNEPNHHLYSWNPQTLAALVTDCGFEVQEASAPLFGYDRLAARWAERARVGDRGYRALRRGLHIAHPIREVFVRATVLR